MPPKMISLPLDSSQGVSLLRLALMRDLKWVESGLVCPHVSTMSASPHERLAGLGLSAGEIEHDGHVVPVTYGVYLCRCGAYALLDVTYASRWLLPASEG